MQLYCKHDAEAQFIVVVYHAGFVEFASELTICKIALI